MVDAALDAGINFLDTANSYAKGQSEEYLGQALRGRWERVHAGATLIQEGQPGDFFCVLVDGEVRVTKNKKLLSVLGSGECFGEMAYLSVNGHARGASVAASAESHILRMRVADLEQASIACRSKFDRAFIGILVDRLNLANTRLTSA